MTILPYSDLTSFAWFDADHLNRDSKQAMRFDMTYFSFMNAVFAINLSSTFVRSA